ncbi:hypothetical protein GL213_14280 [Halogeometricum borinquense]|uniref:Uncharacterized protein n=2 Tax=Halogeometricum borinquense TaxID=60847 RepID=E4NLX1_HALBP|nr:hypothetical protein [Halogeometricum borinquense]ADQ68421.1 hypothetical protein Hbor_28800 [Halogeometricum borinquense DSM 11551]QIB73016.1 hypothetical protein G3I44_01180 [Halogeometricum borinquense]QIQ77588.1 hypothetical protein GL213_14280 [Halogeometricum borinquense]
MDERLERFVREKFRSAGRQYARAKQAYDDGRREFDADLPRDEDGNVRLVCRRHAERRAVSVAATGHPACFEAGHPDCEGCAEDVLSGVVETW